MKDNYIKFYFGSLFILLAASVYPIYMGVITLVKYIQNGFIDSAEYQKYIIPYTPLCLAILISVALIPLVFKLLKRYTLLLTSLLGIAVFFLAEFGFEQIKVIEGYTTLPLESWQYSMCYATPEVLQAIGEPIYAQNNPVYKIHFYLIALLILLAVINVIYGYLKMIKEAVYDKKRPLLYQLISVVLFIGLCILACFTAFYRNGTLNISPLSSLLMSAFFVVFGVTFGVYIGCLFCGRRKLLSVIVPAFMAALTTISMYIGELVLLGGVLFKFGSGIIFEPMGIVPFAIIDIIVILFSGAITYLIMCSLKNNKIHS